MKKENSTNNYLNNLFQNQRKKDELSAPSLSTIFEKAQKKHTKMKRNKWLLIGILSIAVLSIGLYTQSQKRYNTEVDYEVVKASLGYYETIMEKGKVIINDIQFDYDNAAIRPSSMPIIHRIADMLKAHPDLKLSIEGHTDSDGSTSYNLKLSEARAQAVKAALLNLSISESRLQASGFGETKPMFPNDSDGGKMKNRRVELVRK
ncbi:MAG: OmpA family protein [Bacteroidetes bacterium]|nr:OmpA family protein [Bacteroidota bacterium]